MHVTRYSLPTINGGIPQSCKLVKQPVGLVLLFLHFVLDILKLVLNIPQLVLNIPQLVLNSLQQESWQQENLTSQLLPMSCVYDGFPYLGCPAGTFSKCG